MFLKDFIGKKVLSHEGKVLGYTRAAFFSSGCKRITALLCSDEEEEDFILPLSQKQTVKDAFIMPRRSTLKITGTLYSPLLKQVYSVQGKFLGCVSEMLFDNVTAKTILVENKEYPLEQVKSFGDCILITDAEKMFIKRSKHQKEKKTQPAVILGKVLKFDILDARGNLLFEKGIKITTTTLKTAALHKKLLELTAKTLVY